MDHNLAVVDCRWQLRALRDSGPGWWLYASDSPDSLASQRKDTPMSSKLPTTRAFPKTRKEHAGQQLGLENMTVAELRAEARRRGLSTTTKLTLKADLIRALSSPAAKPPRRPGSLAAEAAKAPNGSARKAEQLQAFLAAHGWRSQIRAEGKRVTLTAKRSKDSLVIIWCAGSYDYGSSYHQRPDGKRVKVMNASAFKKLASEAAA